MNTKKCSFKLVRVLIIAMLVIPLALGVTSVTRADGPDTEEIIGGGGTHTCALLSSGAVDCWGDNMFGQATDQPGPYTQLSVGETHNCALTPTGAVECWGENWSGEADDRAGPYTQVSAGGRITCALTPTGALDCWGYPYDITYSGPYTQVSAGPWDWCALTPTGAVFCSSDYYYGEGGYFPGPYTQVSTGDYYACALTPSGAVDCWGNNNYGQAIDMPGSYTQVSAAGHHTCAVTAQGAVDCWGSGSYGEADDRTGPYTQVSAGSWHTCALTPSGMADCWGWNAYGQLGGSNSDSAPTANPGGPYLGAVNTAIQFDGSLSSDPENEPLTYAWTFGGGATGTGSLPTHSYTAAGVYDVCLTVNDGSLDSGSACTMAVIYDPSAGFVTGGGWIASPAGAFKADESLAGKATFGFVSRYQKGATVPTGTTAFQFDLAGLAFSSTSYEWLVVNKAGMNAQFKGTGTVNGAADPNGHAYRFMLWAGDGSPDTFRIRIWWEDTNGEHDVYDNSIAQVIGAGNIVVHTGK